MAELVEDEGPVEINMLEGIVLRSLHARHLVLIGSTLFRFFRQHGTL